MTKIESYRDDHHRVTRLNVAIDDRDISFNPNQLVADIRYKLVCAAVERIMEKIGPKLDAAIADAFSDFSKDKSS